MRPLSELRELAAAGAMPLDAPAVLLVEFWKGASPAREFRTSTLSAPESIPALVAVTTDPGTHVVQLEKSPRNPYDGFLFLGRASTCDVIIRDASISKTHAVIEPSPGKWRLRDNRSRNGTWRNGERLKENERVELASGDVIVLGSYPIRLRPLARPDEAPGPRDDAAAPWLTRRLAVRAPSPLRTARPATTRRTTSTPPSTAPARTSLSSCRAIASAATSSSRRSARGG